MQRELDCWAERGLTARVWLRDDDAHRMSQPLARLHDLVRKYRITIGLAIVPGLLHSDLLEFLAVARGEFYPMCHGWKHLNHATKYRPCEFGPDRPFDSLLGDAELAYEKFHECFDSVKVIFVPPYNCINQTLVHALPGIGFAGLSLGPSVLEARLARAGSKVWIPPVVKIDRKSNVTRVDAQVDLIDWQRRTAKDPGVIADCFIGHLRLRRWGIVSPNDPIGILTHHLNHSDQVWRVCEDLLDCVCGHRATAFELPGEFVQSEGP